MVKGHFFKSQENNALNVLISRILNVLLGFEEVSLYHVKREFNAKGDYWAKLASHLISCTYIKNGLGAPPHTLAFISPHIMINDM